MKASIFRIAGIRVLSLGNLILWFHSDPLNVHYINDILKSIQYPERTYQRNVFRHHCLLDYGLD